MKNASSLTATQSALSLHDHAARTHRAALCNLDSKVTHPSFVVEFLDGKRNGSESLVLEPKQGIRRVASFISLIRTVVPLPCRGLPSLHSVSLL